MTNLRVDDVGNDDARRNQLYQGDLFVRPSSKPSLELCEFAKSLIMNAFAGLDPEFAQFELPVERYAAILAELKPKFIHHPESKRLIRELLVDAGCDPDATYFDVPRMRSSTSDEYLTTGIAYAFHPHRDTWYSAPMCQINWWLPIYPLDPSNAMAFHPRYWSTKLTNSSCDYNYQKWNATSRFNAVEHIKTDTRVQPRALEPVEAEPDLRVLPPVGGAIAFSAAQLHSSVQNISGRTRFSLDFRVVNINDLAALKGASNIDSYCTGTAMGDYLRVSDLSHIPDHLIARYMNGHPQAAPQTAA